MALVVSIYRQNRLDDVLLIAVPFSVFWFPNMYRGGCLHEAFLADFPRLTRAHVERYQVLFISDDRIGTMDFWAEFVGTRFGPNSNGAANELVECEGPNVAVSVALVAEAGKLYRAGRLLSDPMEPDQERRPEIIDLTN
jgi:hypothetical protein